MSRPSEHNPSSIPETEQPHASETILQRTAQSGSGEAGPWPEWLTQRLQLSIPAWAIALGAVALLLIALD